ncbi:GntR family transcriptional regulator [Micromonospora globispora]|uniref:GntR family transcriptional regulator n=1 Tax=Micromonospora globispora TaxID=1450148 RepID=A0A317K6F8_9ACTN|nr:GntR family transcriptional regulator [Micromonospora globispora]
MAPVTSGDPTTRSAFVHAQLREDVLRGVLPPGSRLRFVELAERFSVSQSVVREALTRLAEQGLAVAMPQQGFRVRPLTLADLDELTEARIEIETLVLRRSIQRGGLAWESSVLAAHHTLANTPLTFPSGDVNPEWAEAHDEFHSATLRGCGNERLLSIASSLRDAASLYRWWSRTVGHDENRDHALEHRQILDATNARDEEGATRALAQHIQRTSDALRTAASEASHQQAS